MARGRRPQPANLLLLSGRGEGQDSAGRLVPVPPPFERSVPKPPAWLTREAKAEWRRVAPGLERLDLMKPEDCAAFSGYCEAWSRFAEATKTIKREGITKTNPESGNVAIHPAVHVAEKASTTLRLYAQEFGLTPSAERNVSKRDDNRDPDEANPFAEPSSDIG